ncbi:DUF5363 domain-containing protein [Vibrio cincinnatiensis]|nr:DUF5363 domain-containing protein [Vibrio cincinnatiensis]
MWLWLSQVIARYDAWCKQLGLTPEQKRSCVPYRQETNHHDASSSRTE